MLIVFKPSGAIRAQPRSESGHLFPGEPTLLGRLLRPYDNSGRLPVLVNVETRPCLGAADNRAGVLLQFTDSNTLVAHATIIWPM